MNEKILASIYSVVDQLNLQNKQERALEKSPHTILLGKDGQLDSLGLINLIVAVEEKIEEDFGQSLTLADDRALSQKVSPFQTMQTLAEYVAVLLKEKS